jgi:hypothetical protein
MTVVKWKRKLLFEFEGTCEGDLGEPFFWLKKGGVNQLLEN